MVDTQSISAKLKLGDNGIWYSQDNQSISYPLVVTLFSAGFIIFCIGVLGEYVSRLIEISEIHPKFLIKEGIDPFERGA